jgi:hypothetical protein
MPAKGIGPAPCSSTAYDRDLSHAVAHRSGHFPDEFLTGKAHLNDIAASDAPVIVPFAWPVLRHARSFLCFPDWCHPRRGPSFLNKNSYPSRTTLLPCYNINLQVNGNLASEDIVANVRKTLDSTETLLQDTDVA